MSVPVSYTHLDVYKRQVSDLIHPNDFVVLVVPIDKAAPKGRLILPQQQTIRDILDTGATAIVTRDSEFADTLNHLGKAPSLVITDSQVFGKISKLTPPDIPLTSFSILFARYKGNLDTVVNGACALDTLQDGDTILPVSYTHLLAIYLPVPQCLFLPLLPLKAHPALPHIPLKSPLESEHS